MRQKHSPLIGAVREVRCLVVETAYETQKRCVDGVKADDTCRELQSRNSSDIVVAGFRCWAGNGCCGDGTSRMPERCAGVSLVVQIQLLLLLGLLTMLTLRPQRYEPQKPPRFARARFVTTILGDARSFCKTARRLDKSAAGGSLTALLSPNRHCSDKNVLAFGRESVVRCACACVVANDERQMARHRIQVRADRDSRYAVLSSSETVQQ